jgi:taurine---2-oxoglutarate transaminase
MTDEGKYVLHTWTRQADWRGPTVVGGQGAWFWDEDGRRYLDLSSQAECCNLGHQHPAVVRAIREQAASLCYVSNSWGASSRRDLARKIVTLANGASADGGNHAQEDKPGAADQANLSEAKQTGFGKVFFTCDGAEATENAIKIARWYTGRHKIVSRYRSYHGATHAAMKAGGDARGWNTADGLTGVVHVLPPYCFRCPFGLRYPSCSIRCAAHVEDVILFEGPHTVAAVIAEPAAGTNGIIPPVEYWPRLREICDRHDILLIADEVMSGFGRCGEWFAWQCLGAVPDLFTMAKGLTGAHIPLGAVCVSSRVAEYFDDHLLETGLTYSGHPLACAAGVAAIQAYEDEKLIERAQKLGSWMFGQLHELCARHQIIADLRGLGLFAVLEMDDSGGGSPAPPFPRPLPWLKVLTRTALERGVNVAVRGNLLILCPPLVIDQTDLESGISVIESLL